MKPQIFAALALSLISTLAFAQQGNPGVHFIENWDLNGDGKVTLEEASERRGDVFTSFDADEDGALNDEEYAVFDEARANDMQQIRQGQGQGMGQGMGGMRNAVDGMMLENNDMNGDGKVTRDEFIGRTGWWIEQMDRNGDGVVTTTDFGRN